MCLLNEGNAPTFETARAATCIDITIASPALASLMKNWTVQSKMHMSDHHLITPNLPITPDRMPLRKGQHLKKANWTKFTRLINESYAEYTEPILWTTNAIDNCTTNLHAAIEAALDQVAPIKPYHPKKSVFSWWNSDLEEICKKSRRAHDFARRQPDLHERWEAYRAARKELKNSSLKSSKRQLEEIYLRAGIAQGGGPLKQNPTTSSL
jgi:hypothetical protein